MSYVIVCPKCQRRYQVKQDPSGRQVKCPSCRSTFSVPSGQVAQASQPSQNQQRQQARQGELAKMGVGGTLPQPPVLFPQQAAVGPADPLANHVIDDPGFAAVDLEEIRERQRAKEAEKFKNPFQTGTGKKDLLGGSQEMDINALFLAFGGRIPRRVYWMAIIGLGFINNGVNIAIILLLLPTMPIVALVVLGLFALLSLYMSLAISAKRWHDRGKSAWWNLLQFVPIVGAIWTIVELGFLRGTKGRNKYGADPT